MARHESDREDLIREAVALTERVELNVVGHTEPVVCGFRPSGALNLYFGQDPVYQFDQQGLLRRAFVQGLLYRSQQNALVQLRRERQPQQTVLLSRQLTAAELQSFRNDMRECLQQLLTRLTTPGEYMISRCVPATEGFLIVQRVCQLLDRILAWNEPWLSATIRGRSVRERHPGVQRASTEQVSDGNSGL